MVSGYACGMPEITKSRVKLGLYVESAERDRVAMGMVEGEFDVEKFCRAWVEVVEGKGLRGRIRENAPDSTGRAEVGDLPGVREAAFQGEVPASSVAR